MGICRRTAHHPRAEMCQVKGKGSKSQGEQRKRETSQDVNLQRQSSRKVISLPSTLVSVDVCVSAPRTASNTHHLSRAEAVDRFVLAQWFLEEFGGELAIY